MVRIRVKECVMSTNVLAYIDGQMRVLTKTFCVFFLFGHFAFQSLDRQNETPLSCDHFCVGVCRPVRRSFHMMVETEQDTFPPFSQKALSVLYY